MNETNRHTHSTTTRWRRKQARTSLLSHQKRAFWSQSIFFILSSFSKIFEGPFISLSLLSVDSNDEERQDEEKMAMSLTKMMMMLCCFLLLIPVDTLETREKRDAVADISSFSFSLLHCVHCVVACFLCCQSSFRNSNPISV